MACSIAALAASDEARAQSRLEEIQRRGELRVCIWPDYFAISFRNPRNGTLEGLEIDLARALARRLGTRVHFVETDFVQFISRLRGGDCDVATMAAVVTPERLQRVAMTRSHLASAVYAVTTRNNGRVRGWADIDRPGNVVAVGAGTFIEQLMRSALRQAELLVIHPPATREAELLAGRADVFMTDFAYSRRVATLQDWAVVIAPPDRFGETRSAWAAPLGEAEWLAELNGFLDAARADGTLARAAARHGLTPIVAPAGE